MFSDLRFRLRSLFLHNTVEEEMNNELRFHFEQQVEKLVRSGMSKEEARRQAWFKFGGEEKVREECREARGVRSLEMLLQDLHYGARMLVKHPSFTMVAVLTLALGMGATTAIFSVVDAVLLQPLPFRDPSRLVVVWENSLAQNHPHNVAAPANFLDWENQNTVFEGMTAMADTSANLTGSGNPQQIVIGNVTPGFMSVVGVNPILGSGFSPDNWKEGNDNVVLLDHGFWKERFGGDPGIVGRTIELNGKPVIVVGVAPKDFTFFIKDGTLTGSRPQMWSPWAVPKDWGDRKQGVGRYLTVLGRMKPGVTLAQAQDQMSTIASRLQQEYPLTNAHWGATVVSIREQLSGDRRPALLTLFCAVAFVLLIACANVSSLLLARATKREKEIAIRAAIGASRWRIARQLLTESILLAASGGALGLLLAFWGTRALLTSGPKDLLDLQYVTLNVRVLAFTAAVTMLSTIVFGLLPSFLSARPQIAGSLKDEARSTPTAQGTLLRSMLVVGQMSLALVLLVGSGLLIRSFVRLTAVNPGFDPRNLLTFQVGLPKGKYAKDEAQMAFFRDLLQRAGRLPGVRSVSMENFPPLTGMGSATGVHIIGEPKRGPADLPVSGVRVVGPDYFRTMDIPLLAGRSFDERESTEASHVVVVNQAFVGQYMRGENPIGKKISIYMHGDKFDDDHPSEIVGVCGAVHQMGLDSEAKPTVYWPIPELTYSRMTFLVRTSNDPTALVPAIRRELQEIDPELPMASVATMEQLLGDSLARSRFTMSLLGVFAGVALALTAVGIYGVISYTVAQRRHEIGIRMALGAQRAAVLGLVLRQGLHLMIAGVSVGIVSALALTRLMSNLLYGVGAADPATFAAVVFTLLAVAFLSSYVPARHATRVSPIIALRNQ
ncbi:MAG TPA: ABC transporter permease [Candidatus Sulfotelmatobacter sp.]